MSSDPEYEVECGAEGNVRRIKRRHDGQAFEPASTQDFACYLSWVSKRADRPEEYSRLTKADYFVDEAALVQFVRDSGFLLYVEPSATTAEGDIQRLRPGGMSHKIRGLPDELFVNLCFCSAPPSYLRFDNSFDGVVPRDAAVFVTESLLQRLDRELQDEDSDVRSVSSWTVDRTFVYLDISDFSRHAAGQQALIIRSLIRLTSDERLWPGIPGVARADLLASICIGDGYIYAFRHAWLAAFFAAYLATLIELHVAGRHLPVSFHFRIGVHVGPVYRFWDPGRRDWNFVGDGINEGQRVLSAIGPEQDDVVFISAAVRETILAPRGGVRQEYAAILNSLQNRGRRKDKHGEMRRLYEVNHNQFARYYVPL